MPFMFPILLPFPSPQTYHSAHNLEKFCKQNNISWAYHCDVVHILHLNYTFHLASKYTSSLFYFQQRGIKMLKKRNITVATWSRVVQARSFTRSRQNHAYSGAPRGHRRWLPKKIRLQTLAPSLLKTPLSQSSDHHELPLTHV